MQPPTTPPGARPAGSVQAAACTKTLPLAAAPLGRHRHRTPAPLTGFSRLLPVLALAALCVLAAPPAALPEEHDEDAPHKQTGTHGPDDLRGGDGNDLLIGKRGNDELRGKGGNDELRGGRGDDLLRGGAGDDLLVGGRGKDVLRGGVGNDTLQGGNGDDRFAFPLGASGHKVITDFEPGDVIALGADPVGGSWPTPATIVAAVVEENGRYTYTLLPGLTVQTNTPLAVGDFIFLGNTGTDPVHAVTLPGGHTLASWVARSQSGSLSVPAGEHRDAGGVRFSCPAAGDDCALTIASENGAVTVSSSGGAATASTVPPAHADNRSAPPPPPTASETTPATLPGATAHGIASAIVSLRDEALGDQFVSWPAADRPLTFGPPYAALPLALHVPGKGILGGELDNDGNPATPTGFVAAAAPPAIAGWTGTTREWRRTNGAGVTITDTVAVYAKANVGESYLTFGWWTRVPGSSALGLGTFGNAPFTSNLQVSRRNSLALQDAWPRGANAFVAGRHKYWPGGFTELKALSGTATYSGGAAGQWSERAAGARDGASGPFTADATLTADFDTGFLTLSGTIANFRNAAGTSLGSWTATLANDTGGLTGGTLNGGGFVYHGNTAGAAGGHDWSGGWVAQFFRRLATDSQTAHPTALAGVFQAHHGTPAMTPSNDQGFVGVLGAFGAEKQ